MRWPGPVPDPRRSGQATRLSVPICHQFPLAFLAAFELTQHPVGPNLALIHVMKTSLLLSSVVSALAAASASGQVLVAEWTFESSVPTTAGPHAAESGAGSASGLHASAAAVYSNPAGNGSTESFSSNNWGIGDYYQFQVNSVGPTSGFVEINWEQTRSGTGPANWELTYSTDGSSFTTATAYSVSQVTWNSAAFTTGSSFSWDASAVTGGLLGESTLYFRLQATVAGAAAGTSRVDDVNISVVPEPHEYAALAGVGLLGFAAWRRSRRA